MPQEYPREEIRNGADAGHTDTLAAQILDPLDLRRRHGEDDHAIDRDGYVDGIGSGELGIDARRTADCRDVYASADKRLDRARSRGDVNELDIQSMALEYSRLFGDPRDREGRGDRGIRHAQLLRRFGGRRHIHETKRQRNSELTGFFFSQGKNAIILVSPSVS